MKSEMENKDWLNEYSSLKQVGNANPFSVPAGYFDDLGDRIVARKNIEELKDKESSAGFIVPENYFNELASNIQSRINIEQALNNDNAGYTVPENYFDQLTNNIQSRVNIEQALTTGDAGFTVPSDYFDELASNIQSRVALADAMDGAEAGFTVPDSYFENLQQQVQSRIFIEETLSEQAESFAVPQDYFEQLNDNILNKTVNAVSVKREGVVRRMFTSAAFKYATAACFAVAIGGGILISQLNSPVNDHTNSFLHKQLANVPVDEIKNYLKLNVDAGDTQQTVAAQGTPVNDADLTKDLQNYADSAQ